ncbi:DUF5704 domain-containing protein [Saccharibacillus sp. JS10]|uniref:DUF5704 domain-containing protein n=1 Tax=Saccharibacillus sp. JS10 TaxID=2950552 RepID=UPI00210AF035|nr:DUF5704 domain-containing protein [Saccharibacillus sp. JS10]MCQ4086544.1 DUF5704 domain-containing protein [Saccharibacillus sp. JS10]
MRKRIALLSAMLLFSSIVSLSGMEAASEPPLKPVSYNSTERMWSPDVKKYEKFKFSRNPEATTAQLREDAGEGKKISKIVFYQNGEVIKTVPVNSQKFQRAVEFSGKPIKVGSAENEGNGSWFAWQRDALWDIGNTKNTDFAGRSWWAGKTGSWEFFHGSVDGQAYPDPPAGVETIKGKKYDEFPGRAVKLTIKYKRDKPFYSDTFKTDFEFPEYAIDNRSSIITKLNPSKPDKDRVRVVYDTETKDETNGLAGSTEKSTRMLSFVYGQYLDSNGKPDPSKSDTRDLTYAVIQFVQQHGDRGYKYEIVPGADKKGEIGGRYNSSSNNTQAMIFYYAAYNYTVYSYSYQYPDSYRVYTEDGPTPTIPTEPGMECTITDGRTITGSQMTPSATGVIKADQRGNESFDVLQGIPTSESLYVNVLAQHYLYQDKFQEKIGTCTYKLTVERSYELKWDPKKTVVDDKGVEHEEPDPQSETETKQHEVTVERKFSYWVIDSLGVYAIDKAILNNYAFENEQIEILPADYKIPKVSTVTDGHYEPEPNPEKLQADPWSNPDSNAKTKPSLPPDSGEMKQVAEDKIGKVKVQNDTLTFNSQTIIDGKTAEEKAPEPKQIPTSQVIGNHVLYSKDNQIPNTKMNRQSASSSGEIEYVALEQNINADDGSTYPIGGLQPVTVHTPVVNYSSASDDQAHNQKTKPNFSRMAFILDRPFRVQIPTSGQHTNYPGYGNRDYAKYFRSKQVRFPFDVYSGDRSTFYEKNTWIDVPVPQLEMPFFLPVWVDEGDYTVEFRNIAENAPDVELAQQDANLDLNNHVASDTVNVEVIGRLYDFHITDIADYNWELAFRKEEGSAEHTGNTYWSGLQNIDGATRGNKAPFTLPILPGSHPLPGYKNITVKTGYPIKFDLKTKGNMFGKTDGIRITPSFTFVSRDGQMKTPVDLYYNDDHRSFIQVGSPEDTQERFVILNDRLRNVPEEELNDTARYKYNHYYSFAEMNGISRDVFIRDYINRFTKLRTPVGGFDLLLLPEQVRTLIGPKTDIPNTVDYPRVNAAVQKWYGQYSLPGDPYVVAKGTNIAEYGRTHGGLTRRSPIFLRDGYIILNFNIESIQNGNLKEPHLQYMNAPLMNQWTLEGFKRTVQDSWKHHFTLRDGDLVFYNADKSYKNDFEAQVNR